ncbi:hypothetical protein HOP50_05g39770 [Chloropicon primus]|nr:hypothetical protein HOP50_05g39770 [Chloropicon primus]
MPPFGPRSRAVFLFTVVAAFFLVSFSCKDVQCQPVLLSEGRKAVNGRDLFPVEKKRVLPWDLIKQGKVPRLKVVQDDAVPTQSEGIMDRMQARRRYRQESALRAQEARDEVSRQSTRQLNGNVFEWLSDVFENIKEKVTSAWQDFLQGSLVQAVTDKLQQIGSQIQSSTFLDKIGNALEDILDEAVQVDFEIPDLVNSLLDGLVNSTRSSVFMNYMDNIAELGQDWDLDILEEIVNGTIGKFNLKEIAHQMNFDEVKEAVNDIVRKTRFGKRRKYFTQAIKAEIENSFDKFSDIFGDVGDALESVGDFIEDALDSIEDFGEDVGLGVRDVVKTAVQKIKDSTMLDVDLDEMVKNLVEKIESIDINLQNLNFQGAMSIVEYIFDLVRERGLSFDGILQEVLSDLITDLKDPNSTIVDLIEDLDEDLGQKVENLIAKVKDGDYGDLKLWSKLSIFAEIFGARHVMFSDGNMYPDEATTLQQTFDEYTAAQDEKPTNLVDYLKAVFEVFFKSNYNRPQALVKCVVGFPTKPLPCFSVLLDLVVNAKGMKFDDILSLVMDSIGLLFRGGQKYDVPIPLKPNSYLERASVVYGMKLKLPGKEGLVEKALKALIEIVAEKANIPKSKVFLQSILYECKSTWKVNAKKNEDSYYSYAEISGNQQLRNIIKSVFAHVMKVPDSTLSIEEVTQARRRRALLQATDSAVMTFSSVVDASTMAAMNKGGDVGFIVQANNLQGKEFGTFVQADDFDYTADIQLTAENLDMSSQLGGSSDGNDQFTLEITSAEVNNVLSAWRYSDLGDLTVMDTSSIVGEEGQYRRSNAVNLDVLYASSRNIKEAGSGKDSIDKQIIMLAGAAVAGLLLLGIIAVVIMNKRRAKKAPHLPYGIPSRITLAPSFPAHYKNGADPNALEHRTSLKYTPNSDTQRVMNPVFV